MSEFKKGDRVRCTNYPGPSEGTKDIVGQVGTVIAAKELQYGFAIVKMDNEVEGMQEWYFEEEELEHE